MFGVVKRVGYLYFVTNDLCLNIEFFEILLHRVIRVLTYFETHLHLRQGFLLRIGSGYGQFYFLYFNCALIV